MTKKDKNTNWAQFSLPHSFTSLCYVACSQHAMYNNTTQCFIQIGDSTQKPKTKTSIWLAQSTTTIPLNGVQLMLVGY